MYMADDVLLNKVEIIERCLRRIVEEYSGHEDDLDTDYTRQDSIILNLQRACEASIDAAMHVVRLRRLGIPQDSREAFVMLREAGVLRVELSTHLQAMVGFRNIAVHDYRKLNIEIVRSIIQKRLADFREFSQIILQLAL